MPKSSLARLAHDTSPSPTWSLVHITYLFLATTGVTKATGGLDCCFGFSRAWELKKLVIFVPLSLLVLEGGHHLGPLLLATVSPSLLLVSRSRGGASSPKGGMGALRLFQKTREGNI